MIDKFPAACLLLGLATCAGWADDTDYLPPDNYYSAASGTGAVLKGQLATAMSVGHIQRRYGDFRQSALFHDADLDNPGNIVLAYTRTSVSATWDAGATWSREHVWPVSRQPGSAPSNSTTGLRADPHVLRPVNPSINSSRGNKPFGLAGSSGGNAHVGAYYFPGDADKGDIARQLFYADTRWASQGISLVEGPPSGNQMGDLGALIAWHYQDPPDSFERHRNQALYSAGLNPSYYTNNRNAYIDHPEYAWSVYVDQSNDSQITIDGAPTDAVGSSAQDVDLGRVFTGGQLPPAQTFELLKSGNDGTYYQVSTAGAATSSIEGRYNAFRTNISDSTSIDVGIDTSTAAAGLKSGTVTIDNLDITSGFGSGHAAQDGNDQFAVSLAVLDHATASFDDTSELTSLVYDFGAVAQHSDPEDFTFAIHNLESTHDFTADLDFDSFLADGDTGPFETDLAAAAGALSLAAGNSQAFHVDLSTSTTGSFSATYALSLSDENLPGALTHDLSLTVLGQVLAVPEPATWLLLLAGALAGAGIGARRRLRPRG